MSQKSESRRPDKLFMVGNIEPYTLNSLEKWLKNKVFNRYDHGWKDRRGQESVALIDTTQPKNERGFHPNVAVIVCQEPHFLETVLLKIRERLRNG